MEADEKICPRCAETVKLAAKVCKHCGYEFTAADQPVAPPTPSPAPPPPAAPIQINPTPQPVHTPRPYSPPPIPPRPEAVGDPPARGRTLLIVLASIVGVIVLLVFIGLMAGPETSDGGSAQQAAGSEAGSDNAGSGDEAAAPADNGGNTEQSETTAVSSVELARAYNANEVSAQGTYGNKTLGVTGTITGVKLDLFNNPVVEMEGVNEFLPVQASFDQSYSQKISALSKGQEITVRCTSITEVVSAPMLSDCTLPE